MSTRLAPCLRKYGTPRLAGTSLFESRVNCEGRCDFSGWCHERTACGNLLEEESCQRSYAHAPPRPPSRECRVDHPAPSSRSERRRAFSPEWHLQGAHLALRAWHRPPAPWEARGDRRGDGL